MLQAFWIDEAGQDLVEYSMLLALLSLTTVGIAFTFRGSIQWLWVSISDSLSDVVAAAAS
jgi:Flp pilus assembly pilin Flp